MRRCADRDLSLHENGRGRATELFARRARIPASMYPHDSFPLRVRSPTIFGP